MGQILAINSPESNGPFIVLSTSLVSVGELVKKNQVIIILNGDKVQFEIISPNDGVVTHILIEEGSVVTENSVMCLLEVRSLSKSEEIKSSPRISKRGRSNRMSNFLGNPAEIYNTDGTFAEQVYTLSDGIEMPLNKEACIATIVSRPFCLMLENTYNCAKIRFSWDDTKDIIKYGILAYRVDWDWQFMPNHYTKHENELYYVFLEPSKISINILEDVLGNSSYKNIMTTSLKQIVSHNPLHVSSDGKFRSQPSSLMATVAMAIGIQEMEIVQSVRKES